MIQIWKVNVKERKPAVFTRAGGPGQKKGQPAGQPFLYRMSLKRILVKTLFNTSRLTSALTQVVQFSFTYSTTTFNSNAVNYRRVSLEDTLNAFAVGDFANSECRVQTAVTNSDNHALECLQTFFGTFNNPYFHFHGITRTEGRYVLLHLLLFNLLDNVAHNLISYPG